MRLLLVEDKDLVRRVGVAQIDADQEAVELGFGQRKGAFEFDRVLGREDVERLLELVGAPLDGDAVLLHRLEEGGLGPGSYTHPTLPTGDLV